MQRGSQPRARAMHLGNRKAAAAQDSTAAAQRSAARPGLPASHHLPPPRQAGAQATQGACLHAHMPQSAMQARHPTLGPPLAKGHDSLVDLRGPPRVVHHLLLEARVAAQQLDAVGVPEGGGRGGGGGVEAQLTPKHRRRTGGQRRHAQWPSGGPTLPSCVLGTCAPLGRAGCSSLYRFLAPGPPPTLQLPYLHLDRTATAAT